MGAIKTKKTKTNVTKNKNKNPLLDRMPVIDVWKRHGFSDITTGGSLVPLISVGRFEPFSVVSSSFESLNLTKR
jgi:hypothetical protein